MAKGILTAVCLAGALAGAVQTPRPALAQGYPPPPPPSAGAVFGGVVLGSMLGAGLATLMTAPRPAPPPTVLYTPAPPVPVAPVVVTPFPVAPVYAAPVYAAPGYTGPAGPVCREYQGTAVIGGVQRPVIGTACLQPDGSWRMMP